MTNQRETEREIEFLKESDALEGVALADYTGTPHEVLAEARARARARDALKVDDLLRWHARLAVRAATASVESATLGRYLARLMERVHEFRVPSLPTFDDSSLPPEITEQTKNAARSIIAHAPANTILSADILGEMMFEFSVLRPFATHGGQLERLIASYIATWLKHPLIVFRASERVAYDHAHTTVNAMRIYTADKLREAIYFCGGGPYLRERATVQSDIYLRGPVVERGDVIAKQDEWRRAGEGGRDE